MLIATLVALMLATSPPALSPDAEALIAPVGEAIAQVRARHAASPPPANDTERLVRMGELDQAGRYVIMALDFSRVPEAERTAALDKAAAWIEAVDAENQAALLAMVPPEGWFLRSRYGKGADAAFHIVQHADEALWRRFLPVLEPLVATGEVDGQKFGMMYDRLAVSEGRLQRYGSQFRCDNGKWRPYPMEDPDRVEERRAAIRFGWTYAEAKAQMQSGPYCPQTRNPPPPGMDVTD